MHFPVFHQASVPPSICAVESVALDVYLPEKGHRFDGKLFCGSNRVTHSNGVLGKGAHWSMNEWLLFQLKENKWKLNHFNNNMDILGITIYLHNLFHKSYQITSQLANWAKAPKNVDLLFIPAIPVLNSMKQDLCTIFVAFCSFTSTDQKKSGDYQREIIRVGIEIIRD